MSPEEDLAQLECMTERLGRPASEGTARHRKVCLECCCPDRLWNGDTRSRGLLGRLQESQWRVKVGEMPGYLHWICWRLLLLPQEQSEGFKAEKDAVWLIPLGSCQGVHLGAGYK